MLQQFFVIQYSYPGTSNGQPVGEVYVQAMPEWHTQAMAGKQGYSYTKSPHLATWFLLPEAEEVIKDKPWPNAKIVEIAEAPTLP